MRRIGAWLRRVTGAARQDSGHLPPGTDLPTEVDEEQAAELLHEVEDATVTGDHLGLHEITKKLDKWFAIEVWRLEQEALRHATEWASAGLPRAGVTDDQLPVEKALAAKATELHRKWSRQLRTKIQDGIASATRRVGNALFTYRENATASQRDLRDIDNTAGEIERVEAAAEGKTATLGFSRLLGAKKFWGLIILLVCVDWIANVPIFHELLPKAPGAEQMWVNIVAQSERYQVFGGLYRTLMRILFAPEVALLALGVIAFLVFLAHVFGDGLRNRLAVSEEDLPSATLGIRAHRRQYFVPVAFGLVAAGCVIFVLFLAREQLKQQTDARLQVAATQVQVLEEELAAARNSGNLQQIGELNGELRTARNTLDDRRQRAEYAAGIQGMNIPITLLNTVLFVAAALASYLKASNSLTQRRLVEPKLMQLQERLESLHAQAASHRAAMQRAAADVQDHLSQADRLLHSRPLAGWSEKADRLHGVIALFRAENAKERGVDPASIAAFNTPIILDISHEDSADPFEAPAELLDYAQSFRKLQSEMASVGQEEFAYAGGGSG